MTLPNPHYSERKAKQREGLKKVQAAYVEQELDDLCKMFRADLKRKAIVLSTMNWDTDALGITVDEIRQAARQLIEMEDGKRQYGFEPELDKYLGELTEATLAPE